MNSEMNSDSSNLLYTKRLVSYLPRTDYHKVYTNQLKSQVKLNLESVCLIASHTASFSVLASAAKFYVNTLKVALIGADIIMMPTFSHNT